MRKTYRVVAEREGSWWVLTFPELGPGASQAKRLDLVDRVARDYINGITVEDPDSFDVSLEPKIEGSWHGLIADARDAKGAAQAAQDRAFVAQRKAVGALLGDGLTYRDAGFILGLTHQRIAQLKATS